LGMYLRAAWREALGARRQFARRAPGKIKLGEWCA